MAECSQVIDAIINMAVESWRFSKNYERIVAKLDAGEQGRHISQCRWFIQKITDSLEVAGLRLVDVGGQVYSAGIAATPINLDEFAPTDTLRVDYMLEPIFMGDEGVVRAGKMVLCKVNNHE